MVVEISQKWVFQDFRCCHVFKATWKSVSAKPDHVKTHPLFLQQLALTGAPSGSEIFLFTDATAKDEYLKGTVIALIEQTKSVVSSAVLI